MKVFRGDCRRKTSECEVQYTGKMESISVLKRSVLVMKSAGTLLTVLLILKLVL